MTGFESAIAVVILLPLAASVLPILFGRRYPTVGWSIAVGALLLTAMVSIPIFFTIFTGHEVRYTVGGIPAAYGVELVADSISGVLIGLTLGIILGSTIHTRRADPRENSFYSGILLLTGGTLGITLAADLFNLYVFLEIVAIAAYALIATADSRRSTYASFKYLILGTLGATIYLLGVGYVFIATGTLNMQYAAPILSEIGYSDPVVVTSFILIVIGLGIKIALVPLHTWLPDAHATAPDAISAIVSGLLPAIAVYALLRIVFSVYSIEFLAANPLLTRALLLAGLASLFLGSIFAMLQQKLKLLLAYSTIAQMGLAVVGLAVATDRAIFGSLVHLFGHGVVKAALFLLVGLFALRYGAKTVDEYAGLARHSPLLSGMFLGLGITLVGIPPTIGFTSKWYIAVGAIEAGSWGVAGLVIVSTLFTLAYIVPIVDRLYFHPSTGPLSHQQTLPVESVIVILIGVVLAIGLGVLPVWFEPIIVPSINELIT